MQNGYHPPVEQYLAAIWELEEEGVEVIRARLAERVGHTAPSVSEMVRRLQSDDYLKVGGRVLAMTPEGRERAVSMVRKNRLAERLLTDIIGIPWHRIHDEACRWEHVISDEVEQHLVVLLKNPPTCPHGNAIPASGGPERELSTLADAAPGDSIRLERVAEQLESDAEALVYLDDHGFIPGTTGEVRSNAPDGTITVDLDGVDIALGPASQSGCSSAKSDPTQTRPHHRDSLQRGGTEEPVMRAFGPCVESVHLGHRGRCRNKTER